MSVNVYGLDCLDISRSACLKERVSIPVVVAFLPKPIRPGIATSGLK